MRLPHPVPADAQHPGTFVRREILDHYRLSVTEAAKALGITRAALSTFLNEHSSLSPEMAIRLEKAFGADMEMLMRLQTAFDIACARAVQHRIDVSPYAPSPRKLAGAAGAAE